MTQFRQAFYNRYLSTFKDDENWERKRAIFHDWCQKNLQPFLRRLSKQSRIIELGCGQGQVLDFLNKQGFSKVEGVDTSEEQVARATRYGFEIHHSDVFEFFRSSDNVYDLVLAIDFVEHFTRQELIQLFYQLKKALSKEGYLILRTPNGQGIFAGQVIYGDITHMTILTPQSLSQILKFVGFEIVSMKESISYAKGLKKMRYLLWNLSKIGLNIMRRVSSGKSQDIWTENFICIAKKETVRETER
jgi:2-polyprenyl-3-methyl-5-hydroxy-6-metoxy-1,4-benzoquinol methylase